MDRRKFLEVTVISGKELAPKDDNGFSDPYCVLKLSTGAGAKTHAIKKTLDPTWNQTFELGVLQPNSVFKLTCWDHDTFSSDDFMGQVTVNIGKRMEESAYDWVNQWYELKGRGLEEEISGFIHLKFVAKVGEPPAKPAKGGLLGSGGLLGLVPDIPLPSLSSSSSSTPTSKSSKAVAASKQSSASKASGASKDVDVFGVEVEEVMKEQRKHYPNETVPVFYRKLMEHLRERAPQEEGIFRIGGSVGRIQEFIDAANSGEEIDYRTVDIHDASGLLKKYLRDMPSPLLTFELHDKLVINGPLPNTEDYADFLKKHIKALPPVNLAMLEMLIDLMQLITKNSHQNKMSTQNLVICISPNLLYDRTNSMLGSMEHMGKIQGIVTMLVQQFDYIFKFEESQATRAQPIGMSKELRRANTRKAEGGRLFMTYDTNGDGVMDREEFAVFYREALMDHAASDADVDAALRVLDRDGNNLVSFEEFTTWWCRMHARVDRTVAGVHRGPKRTETVVVNDAPAQSSPTLNSGPPAACVAPPVGATRARGASNAEERKLPPGTGGALLPGGTNLVSPRSPRQQGPPRGRGAPRGAGAPRGIPPTRGQRGSPRGAPRGRGVPPRGAPRGAAPRGGPPPTRGRGVAPNRGRGAPPAGAGGAPPPPRPQRVD